MITEERPESTEVDGGNFLNANGTFHLFVLEVLPPTNKDGGSINAYFKLHVVCLEGTDKTQIKREGQLTVWAADMTQKPRAIQTAKRVPYRLAECCGVAIQDDGHGRFSFEEQDLRGRHFVAEISINDKGYPGFVFDRIWSVNDPAVANIPKDANVLKQFPIVATAGQTAKPAPTQPQKPAAGGVNLDDL